jgi:hypothetical protein
MLGRETTQSCFHLPTWTAVVGCESLMDIVGEGKLVVVVVIITKDESLSAKVIGKE